MNKPLKISLVMAAMSLSFSAFAQKKGDDIVGIGLAYTNPSTNVGVMSSTSSTFQGALTNATGSVSNESTVSLGLLHMYTDNVGAEFTIGIPPKHTLDLVTPYGSTIPHPAAATMKTWTPTAVAKYFFNDPQSKWRPYLGFGISRVSFHSATPSTTDTMVQAMAGTSMSLSSSWAPVYNGGVIYNLDEKWSINGSLSYIPVKSTATFVGSGATTTGDMKLNTTDFVIRLGYKF